MSTNKTSQIEELKKSQQRYRNLFENAIVGMYRTTIDGSGVLEVNQPLCNISGYTREELLSLPGIIHWSDPKARKEVINQLRRDGIVTNYEADLIAKSGEIKSCMISVKLYPDEGQVEGTVIDITERKRLEEELRQSEERYRTLVENASDIIFRTDNTGHFTFGNPVALRITGYREEELRGKHYRKLIRPDMLDESIKLLVHQYEHRVPNTYHEFPIITKDGHEKWLGQNTQLIVKDGNVVGFQAVARDISERKQAEVEREKLLSELQQALAEIKTLRGFLPICSYCKKIRDDKGYWNQLEDYISTHSEALFSHGICPECFEREAPKIMEAVSRLMEGEDKKTSS
jgi:PAS domain S-box-containing protein